MHLPIPPTRPVHWSTLINFIIQNYLCQSSSICVVWHPNVNFELQIHTTGNYAQYVHIERDTLAESFSNDFYNFTAKQENFAKNGVEYDDMVTKLTVAIEHTHCEAFIAFQEDIPALARAFRNASIFSIWRSQRTKFLFAYRKDWQKEPYFEDLLFVDQPNILVIEATTSNSSIFELQTNKFVGSLHAGPEQLYLLNRYDANSNTFAFPDSSLYPDKLKDLQGREVVLGAFDYRPLVVVDFKLEPFIRDHSAENPSQKAHLDGTEVRVLRTFCELYNCTTQVDTTVNDVWGYVYPNTSADGLVGLIVNRKTQMALGAMFYWDIVYKYLDYTAFLGRSGVTCMVPKPKIETSWTLPLKPFQRMLWLAVVACLILETISLLITRRIEHIFANVESSWFKSFEFGYSTTLQLFISQSSRYVVNATSVRSILFSCYMIDIIVTSIYSGGLASILTLPKLGEAADSLERLNKHGLIWAGTTINWVLSLMDVKDNPVIMGVLANYRIFTMDEIREKSQAENMGFVLERMHFGHLANVDYLTEEAVDRLKIMVDDIYYEYTSAIVPRVWPFLTKYNTFIYNWHSAGFDKFWEWQVTADFLSSKRQQQVQASMYENLGIGPVKLGLSNFAGLILVWLVGLSGSILVFGIELFHHKLKKILLCFKCRDITQLKLRLQ